MISYSKTIENHMLTLRQVDLGIDVRLNGATFQVIIPDELNGGNLVDSEKRLREVFDTFKETITNLGITNEIYDVTSRYTGDAEEVSYYVMFKNREGNRKLYCDGEAALFIVEIDPHTRYTTVRYGFGGCGAGKCPCINKQEVLKNSNNFVRADYLQNEFKSFLELVLPKVIEWDKAHAADTFRKLRAGNQLPPWLSLRIIQNHPGDSIQVGEGEWRKKDLTGMLAEEQVHLVKIGDAGLIIG